MMGINPKSYRKEVKSMRIAEHYEVVVNGKRFAVHYDKAVAESIAKANGGVVRIIPAKTISGRDAKI